MTPPPPNRSTRALRALNRFDVTGDIAGNDTMVQLINLRWIAVAGQLATIWVVHYVMQVSLPILAMLAIVGGLAGLNLVSLVWIARGQETTGNTRLFITFLIDVAALTGLLYLSGGATNPFISLFLLQVVLGAVLLRPWASWAIVAVTCLCFVLLVNWHWPLRLPPSFSLGLFDLYIIGTLFGFALIAVLLVLFVTRINANLRARDARLAAMRQQAAEEDHIVRMGLLASGAAHELGTPLASLSVIINDWAHMPALGKLSGMTEEIEDMRVAVERCKQIVTGILLSAGEARGEKPVITTVHDFLHEVAAEWRKNNGSDMLHFHDNFGDNVAIVSDGPLKQVIWNVLDNALEASKAPVTMTANEEADNLVLQVADDGPGFSDEQLASFGKPYHSTKDRLGGGLGLFLVVNAMRKLGGSVEPGNRDQSGALVTLTLPLAALTVEGD